MKAKAQEPKTPEDENAQLSEFSEAQPPRG